jgi:ABC-type Fe3+-siderophore transport system permease subunit
MDSVIAEIGSSLLNAVPDIIAWTAGIVLAVIMVRRGGLKPEKLLLTGCCLMLAETILSPVVRELVMDWVRGNDTSYLAVGQTVTYTQIPLIIVSLAGIVCLVWAFWIRFHVKKQGEI